MKQPEFLETTEVISFFTREVLMQTAGNTVVRNTPAIIDHNVHCDEYFEKQNTILPQIPDATSEIPS